MNTTGRPVTRLRFRAVDITTATSAPAAPGVAVLRVLTSPGEPLLLTTGGGTAQTEGLRLETPPAPAAGGGYNSSVSADGVQLATPLAPGASIDVNFLLAVDHDAHAVGGDADETFADEMVDGGGFGAHGYSMRRAEAGRRVGGNSSRRVASGL